MKYFFVILFGLSMASCANTDKKIESGNPTTDSVAVAKDSTTIEWIDPTTQDLGKVKEGQVMEITWRFKNTGERPLVISNVSAGCGCTIAETPKEPIEPGKEGEIKAKFDSKGQLHTQHKTVRVYANNTNKNGQGEDVLSFKAEVEQ